MITVKYYNVRKVAYICKTCVKCNILQKYYGIPNIKKYSGITNQQMTLETRKEFILSYLSVCMCFSVTPQMDPLCNGAKKPEGSDPIADTRSPPAKMARLEQNGAGSSAQDRSRQESPGAKNPYLAQKPTTLRPQSKRWHTKGIWDASKAPYLVFKRFFSFT